MAQIAEILAVGTLIHSSAKSINHKAVVNPRHRLATTSLMLLRKFHSRSAARGPMKNIFQSVSRAWSKAPADTLSPKALMATQTLRQKLQDNTDIRPAVLDLLTHLPPSVTYPRHIYSLLDKSVESGQLQVQDLQKMFQTVVEGDTKGQLNSKLFIKLHKLPKIDSQTHVQNAILYFKWLLANQSATQAVKFIQGIRKQHGLSDSSMIDLIETLTRAGEYGQIPQLLAGSGAVPSDSVVQAAYLRFSAENQSEALEKLTTALTNDNPDLDFSRESIIVILDSHISLDVDGKRVLFAALKTVKPDENLEFLELLLMAVMNFRVDKAVGQQLLEQIMTKELVKETWDLLLQWEIYSASNIRAVFDKIEEHRLQVDTLTLSGLLKVADVAKRPESDILALRSYFSDQGVETDAAGYSIIINRALNGIEVEKARQLLLQSIEEGVDWTLDNDRYVPVLSRLLVELCESSTLDDSIKFDVYQRIRMLTTASISQQAQIEMLKMFLYRDSTSDLAKFLIEQWGETPNLPWAQNMEIYTAFMDKILGCSDYREAWELYRIFNTTIALPYESYIPIQKKFCSIGRPDAAHLMFRHLRNRAKNEGILPPGREMYLMLFVEYGKWQYEEGMTELDTYFRMDLNNDLDIDIMNSMLLGYSCLSDSPKVRDLWYETNSFAKGKGFNNLTGSILLKHLAPISLEAVDDLWEEIPSRYGIEPNEDNLAQYLIANCYHGYYSRALEILQQAPEIYKISITPKLIATVYNWTLIDTRKEHVKEWAQKSFPEAWNQLEAGNQLQNILIGENTENDSEESIRYNAIQNLKSQTAGPMLRALHKTTDED